MLLAVLDVMQLVFFHEVFCSDAGAAGDWRGCFNDLKKCVALKPNSRGLKQRLAELAEFVGVYDVLPNSKENLSNALPDDSGDIGTEGVGSMKAIRSQAL